MAERSSDAVWQKKEMLAKGKTYFLAMVHPYLLLGWLSGKWLQVQERRCILMEGVKRHMAPSHELCRDYTRYYVIYVFTPVG